MNESIVGVGGDSVGVRLVVTVCYDLFEIDYQVIMVVRFFFFVLGVVNRSTVGVGGDGEGSRMAVFVCYEVFDLGYQVICNGIYVFVV